jgi:SAM-dependent methyltransferase
LKSENFHWAPETLRVFLVAGALHRVKSAFCFDRDRGFLKGWILWRFSKRAFRTIDRWIKFMGSAEIQGALWGAAPRDWAAHQESTSLPLWSDVLQAAGAAPGVKILDAGCGAGGACVEAAKLGCEVTGVDASPAMLAVARERTPEARFEEADLESLPFDDSAFDAVIAVNSVLYAADAAQAMKELARITRSSGHVVITTWGRPEACEMRDVFGAVVSALPAKPPGGGPFALSAPGTLEGLLTNAGLKVVAQGESRCDFSYPGFEVCWRAMASAGPLRGAMNAVGEAKVRDAVAAAVKGYTDGSGVITLHNTFIWAAGERA